MQRTTLSEAEERALALAADGVLITKVPDRTEKDVFGNPEPGLRVFAKLEKAGLLFQTEEDPIDIDGEPFHFTPTFEITDAGRSVLQRIRSAVPSGAG
jgi:hypothetical protein